MGAHLGEMDEEQGEQPPYPEIQNNNQNFEKKIKKKKMYSSQKSVVSSGTMTIFW